jgi:hypothetical protein
MNRPRKVIVSLGAVTALSLAVLSTTGQEKKGPNIQDPPKGAKASKTDKLVGDLDLAAGLIQYGRANKHAESLLIAAQILHKTPTEPLKVGHTVESKEGVKTKPVAKVDNSPKGLVAEAKKLSSSAHVEALAAATQKMIDETTREAVGGPKVDSFTIQPFQTINWNPIDFVGGRLAVVHVHTGVYGSMILEVRDQFGNVIAKDSRPGISFRCEWYPAFTGPYRFRLINIDTIAFNCGMATN